MTQRRSEVASKNLSQPSVAVSAWELGSVVLMGFLMALGNTLFVLSVILLLQKSETRATKNNGCLS